MTGRRRKRTVIFSFRVALLCGAAAVKQRAIVEPYFVRDANARGRRNLLEFSRVS